MQFKLNIVLSSILLTISTVISADSINNGADYNNYNNFFQQQNEQLSKLSSYLKHLGEYFGYDVTQYCSSGGACSGGSGSGYSNILLNETSTQTMQFNLYNSYLGALLGTGAANSNAALVPNNTEGFSALNSLVGQTYTTPPYSSPSNQGVSVSESIDQQTYQTDPVSQALLNILSTPDYTYCNGNSPSATMTANPNCQLLYREKIMSQVIGPLQKPAEAFSAAYNQQLISQLNIDSLLTPMLYSTNSSNSSNTSSSSPSNNSEGLPAQTQAQQAANFIRYVSGSVNPVILPMYQTYNTLLSTALNYSGSKTPEAQANAMKAQVQLYNYLTKLRIYAAQTSVGVSNLYYILSKRLPQKPISGKGEPSSQALNEFTMASWRLFNPNGGNNQQWLTQINKGSNASVQKEIAILLAEINYQLYLSRQQQERSLMTESVLLLQGMKPDADVASSNAAAYSTSTSGASSSSSTGTTQ
jgi:intracellular multiplication protein IcmX